LRTYLIDGISSVLGARDVLGIVAGLSEDSGYFFIGRDLLRLNASPFTL